MLRMARQLRIQYEGAIYHLMSRGDRREEIFRDDLDQKSFLQSLGVACQKTGWQVHAYCLMSNHFHLVVETPRANLVEGMKWLLGTYTMRFNRRHKLSGHLFAGRYKSLLIDGASVASLLLLFGCSPSRLGKYGRFYAHKRRSP
jgi:putative transposase